MSELTIFAFESAAVRSLDLNGEPWFVATDIANILGYRDAEKMTRLLDDDEKDTHNVGTLGGDQEHLVINESGLYAAILKSRRPEAKAFRKWVTSEVLPSIRKQGSYTAPGAEAGTQFVSGNPAHGADLAVAADRTFRSFLRAARSAGLALPQALRTANRQTIERTGMDMLAELGVDPGEAAAVNGGKPVEMPEEDPLWLSIVEWAAGIEAGEFFTMADIMQKVCGIRQEEKAFQRVSVRVGPMLRRCGFKNRKTRYNGRPIMLWTKR